MKTINSLLSVRSLATVVITLALPLAALGDSNALIPIQAAGAYVERGTMRIQVGVKLGRPDRVTPGGEWVYHNQAVAGSDRRGSLVVWFKDGRVSELALATPATVEALCEGKVVALGAPMKRDSSRGR